MAQKRKKIICFGMAVTDVYSGPFRRDLMDRRFSPFSDLYVTVGGDALNCSSNFAKMGCDTRIIACVGRDALGRSVRRIVEESGVDTTYLLQPEGAHTSMTHLFHGPEKLPYYVLMLGANKEISYEMVTDDMLEGYDHLYYASINALEKMEGHGVAMLLKQAKRLGLSTSMDIKGTGGKFEYLEEALDYCDVFIPNHDEITDVTGLTDLQDIKRFFSRYPLKVLGVKRGAEGSFLTDFKQDLHLGTLFTGTPVDELGAGDAFDSTFVLSWLHGLSLHDCGIVASAASALCLALRGTTTWGRPFKDVMAYARQKGYDIKL